MCTGDRGPGLGGFLDDVLAAGVDIVQLREKGLPARPEIALAAVVAERCRRAGALFSVNDRADLAAVLDPDILHLGQEDLPVAVARSLLGPDVLIGVSTHTTAQAETAAADDEVDYFCVGPTWPTPTKPGRPAAGLTLIERAASLETDKPWFAIGGIDASNLDEVLAAGASRVVVVRAVTDAANPAAAAADLAQRLRSR